MHVFKLKQCPGTLRQIDNQRKEGGGGPGWIGGEEGERGRSQMKEGTLAKLFNIRISRLRNSSATCCMGRKEPLANFSIFEAVGCGGTSSHSLGGAKAAKAGRGR